MIISLSQGGNEKKAETRQRIFDAAMQLLAERSYEDVTIEQICELADVANATFFLHFPTKASLVNEFHRRVNSKIAGIVAGKDGSAIERLQLVKKTLAEEWENNSHGMFQLVNEFMSQPASYSAIKESTSDLTEMLSQIVKDGQRCGEFDQEFDPDILATAIISSWNSSVIKQSSTSQHDAAVDANEQILRLFLYGAMPRTPCQLTSSSPSLHRFILITLSLDTQTELHV